MKKVIDYLYTIEGNYFHRNETEEDITSPGGLYRAEHPKAKIWSYVDELGSKLGVGPSKTWGELVLDEINKMADKDKVKELVEDSYNQYFASAHLNLFPLESLSTMINLYTNSPVGAWKSTQRSIWDLYHEGFLDIDRDNLSTVDGRYGLKTKNALLVIKDLPYEIRVMFKLSLISNMKTHYARIVASNPDEFVIYLKGWVARVDKLKKSKA